MADSLRSQQSDRVDGLGGEAELDADAEADAAVVSKYLPPGYSAEADAVTYDDDGKDAGAGSSTSDSGTLQPGQQESSLKLLGGDIHRDIYKIRAKGKKPLRPKRAATYQNASPSQSNTSLLRPAEQRAPGGFRRQYILERNERLNNVGGPVTRSFVDFLELYGSFAGEDLHDSDDESSVNESVDDEEAGQDGETRPLLGRRKSRRTTRRQTERGDASQLKSFFTLLKAFIGTGIMFLPKAFNNGGMLFSAITLITVAVVTCICFRLLLQCRERYGGPGYGDIGEAIAGRWLRSLILFSITISQIGFVCSGIIFTAENIYIFLDAVAQDSKPVPLYVLIIGQLIVLIPLALIRKISKLGPAAILADAFILFGLTYIWYYDIATIAKRGMNESVRLFNPNHYTLTIGAAIFTFEGIGLILPIQSSMKQPEKFANLLYLVMIIITIIFTSVGALSYATFGSATRTEIISNFPQTSNLVHAVQMLYSLAVLVGTPVQLFPAVRILEGKLFAHAPSGAQRRSVKWEKNAFRTGLVLLCGLIAAVGASDLDKFVALIGSFACVPLVYIYPAFLHYKGVAKSRIAITGDLFLIVAGAVAAVFTTGVTLAQWINP